MNQQRRKLLAIGMGSFSLAVLSGVGLYSTVRPIGAAGALSASAASVFRAIALAVLDGSLEREAAAQSEQLAAHQQRLEATLAGFPTSTQAELSTLLILLDNPAGRYAMTQLRTGWSEVTPAQTLMALQMMRKSSLTLRQQAYHVLRDLTNAAFYADPALWPLMRYPGPTVIDN